MLREILSRLMHALRRRPHLVVDNGKPYHLLTTEELRRRAQYDPKQFRKVR